MKGSWCNYCECCVAEDGADKDYMPASPVGRPGHKKTAAKGTQRQF